MSARSDVFEIVRGNDIRFTVGFTASDDSPLVLTGVSVQCSVKDARTLQKLFDAIVSVIDEQAGEIEVVFPHYETIKLSPSQVLVFDFKLIFPDGSIQNLPVPPLRAVVVDPVTM